MTLLHPSSSRLPIGRLTAPLRSSSPVLSTIRSSLPFPPEKARFHRELVAAVDVVERACFLCIDVKKSLFSTEGRILEKNDRSPVTVADFSVQALISLELSRLFPSIPLVAEEDSAFLRSSSVDSRTDEALIDSVLNAVADKVNPCDEPLTSDDVLGAIDRGGKDAMSFDAKPATYWVLDPIDGTRGFLKGSNALYVVGLALVVEGEITLGVMGCPNWKEDFVSTEGSDNEIGVSGTGIIMVAHAGCGTWTRGISEVTSNPMRIQDSWKRCFVDSYRLVHEARFCIPDSQTWESMPLSVRFSYTVDPGSARDAQKILLLPTCCGSLCKYLMVASDRASVFILRARDQTEIKVWDHAVGVVCVHEAGGQVTDWRGNRLDLTEDQVNRRLIFPSGGVLVTNACIGDSSEDEAVRPLAGAVQLPDREGDEDQQEIGLFPWHQTWRQSGKQAMGHGLTRDVDPTSIERTKKLHVPR